MLPNGGHCSGRYSRRVRDNTSTQLDKGPKGTDERVLTVESARSSVEAVTLHGDPRPANLPGGRPAHTAGVFLSGQFNPAPSPFVAPIFGSSASQVTARFSPLRTAVKDGRFDLHGLSVRIQTGDNDQDLTDLVAINTQPFMFRTADGFATFFHRVRSGGVQAALGVGAFGIAVLAGNASLRGMARAIGASRHANRPLLGREYWGIHTFFADREDPLGASGIVRVPYRYRLQVHDDGMDGLEPSDGQVLARYRDIARVVKAGKPIRVSLWFMLPFRWERLTNWPNVPDRIRRELINPQAEWKVFSEVPMGTAILDTVVDDAAVNGGRTDASCDGLVFDPTRLTKGLHVSEDPMLRARSGIYAESHMRRA